MLKMILPANRIPEGTKVTKVNGTKVYILKNRINLYDFRGGGRVPTLGVDFAPELRYLVDEGNINVIDGTTDLSVSFDTFKDLEWFVTLLKEWGLGEESIK